MVMTLINKSTANRRRASRIYEQVDLFYQKLSNEADYAKPSSHWGDAGLLSQEGAQQFPKSHTQERETLNVNISATGISFTCKEALQEGDHLLLRILLLSRMTVMTVFCEVMYCRPSNPFESDLYPYLVGGKFVNIREEDSKLLHKHILNKRKQQLIVNGLLFALFFFVLQTPDIVFEFCVGIFDVVSEHFVEMIFILYEIISMYLDHAIEFVFHTNFHDTQAISFYLVWLVGLAALFALSKRMLLFMQGALYKFQVFVHRKKASLLYSWHEKTLMHKVGIVSGSVAACLTYLFFFI